MRISHLLLLLILLVILSIVGVLMFTQKEHFETNSNLLVEPVMISKDEIINGFMTDLSGKDIRNVIANATFLHPQTSGYIAQYMKDGSVKYGVTFGYDRKTLDLSSEKFKDVSSIESTTLSLINKPTRTEGKLSYLSKITVCGCTDTKFPIEYFVKDP
jgi:hypothetical protein